MNAPGSMGWNERMRVLKSCADVVQSQLQQTIVHAETARLQFLNKPIGMSALRIYEKEQSSVSSEKEPDFKTASVKDIPVNNENDEHLLENNIETNNLRIPEKLSTQPPKSYEDEVAYELEKFKKNAMIIFNHEHFLVGQRRLGTALDVAALEDTLRQFRFEGPTHNDLTKQNLFDELERFSKMNFNDYGCICVAILTHGQDGGFLRAHDTRYSERDVFACFDARANPTLEDKPIIFLIQACRGSTAAARVPGGRVQNFEFDADTLDSRCRPTESDMLIFHSSFFGRASVRVVEEGSWFIQTVCEQMKLHGSTEHLEKLFRRVRRIVALDKEYKGVKQMPVVTSTLLKKIYLKKKDDTHNEIDGSNSEKVMPCVIVKNSEIIRFTLTMFKNAYGSVLYGAVLTLLILHQNLIVSTCILIVFLIIFEGIRYKVYKSYTALFKEVHHLTMFMVLFNFLYRLDFFYREDIIIVLVQCLRICYYFVCYYFGPTGIISLFVVMRLFYDVCQLLSLRYYL